MKKNGYYTVLKINTDASAEEIKAAFWREQRAYELEGRPFNDSRAGELTEAYEVLSDAASRSSYDEHQGRAAMTMEELEQKVQEGHVRNRFDVMVDCFAENPLRELGLLILAIFIFLLIREW